MTSFNQTGKPNCDIMIAEPKKTDPEEAVQIFYKQI